MYSNNNIITIIKNKKNKIKMKKKHRKVKRAWERREREEREKCFFFLYFSLRSTKIGPYVFIGAKGKVGPRNESYAWVLKSWSFVKLYKVGSFPTYVISSLKAI